MNRGRLLGGVLAMVLLGLGPASSQAALLDANCAGPPNGGGTTSGFSAQTFIAQHTGTLVRGQMTVQKSAGADFYLTLWDAVLNTGPVGGSPIGTSAPVADTAIPNGVTAPVDSVFNPGVPVTAGHVYAIAVRRVNGTSYMVRDRNDRSCEGFEFGSNTGMGTWAFALPQYDYMFQTFVDPPNGFSIDKVKGTKLSLTLPGPGTVDVATSKRVKPGHTAFPAGGAVTLRVHLKKAGKSALRTGHKLKVSITFTPEGGLANTLSTKVKKGK